MSIRYYTAKQAVREFCRALQRKGQQTFSASDLTAYVRGVSQHSYSPETPMRRLRELRKVGEINYVQKGDALHLVF